MSDSSVYIRDHESLIELNNSIEFCADSLLKILESVNNYLNGVKEAFKKQTELLEKSLELAKEELSIAEEKLHNCKSTQEWDEEKGEYCPSCSYEKSDVDNAQAVVDKINENYEQAQRIIYDFEIELDRYKKRPSLGSYPGAEAFLEALAKEHTDKTTNKLQEILDTIYEYLNFSISKNSSSETSTSFEVINSQNEQDRPLTSEEKKVRFENAIERVIERQHQESNKEIAPANRAMRCKRCFRPLAACICSNTRELEYTRENIQLLKNNFSR